VASHCTPISVWQSASYRDSDPDYRSALLDIAAPLSGRSKEDLDGEDIRQHRRALRTAEAALALIVILGVIAGTYVTIARTRQKVAVQGAGFRGDLALGRQIGTSSSD
jgi:hypothetical protein